jgi:glycolate oxidase
MTEISVEKIDPGRLHDILYNVFDKRNVLTSKEQLLVYSFDATAPVSDQMPAAVVLPGSRDEIVELLRIANEYQIPIVPRGSGTGLAMASTPVPGSIVILFNRMNRILEIDQANLTALVEPGVVTAELAAAVDQAGLFYPPDPGSMSISTLGGNAATNAGGLRGLKYGVTGDFVMGLEVVLPTGEILQTGNKCKKDVAGYNLSSLFIGSEGTLGIITQILLRLLPKPETQRTAVAFFNDIQPAAQVVADIIAAKIIPVTLELLDNICIQNVEAYASLGLPVEAGALLLIEVDGYSSQVDQEIKIITDICRSNEATSVNVAKDQAHAAQLKAARRTTLAALARRKPTTILEDVTVPRDKIPEMVRRIREIARKHKVEIAIFGHAGDGNLHPTGMTDARDKAELERVETAFEEIYLSALELGGTITGEHGIGLKKRAILPKQVGGTGIALMRTIKQSLDPHNILNPGKVFEI